jgi:hypothetical protein
VDAIKAIVREHAHPHAAALANQLTTGLRAATKEFLGRATGEPDTVREAVASPPTAPKAPGR